RCEIFGWGCYSAAIHNSGPAPLMLDIAQPKKSYAVGDNLTFSLRSNRDCYFMVYTVSPIGKVEQHDPTLNAIFMVSPMLKADQWQQLPLVGYATIKPPPGNFELGAVSSKEPLFNVGLNEAELREPARGQGYQQCSVCAQDRSLRAPSVTRSWQASAMRDTA